MVRFDTLFLLCLLGSLHSITQTARQPGYREDNSDWWSQLRSGSDSGNIPVLTKDSPASNFEILGVDLSDDDPLAQAMTKLGTAQLVERGDASTGREQICYS